MLKIADIFEDLFPLGFHIFLPISMRQSSSPFYIINGNLLAKAVYLKKVQENDCCISFSLSKYLQLYQVVEIEVVKDEFLALGRVLLEIISPIDVDLQRYDLANYILAGEAVGIGCIFEFEYLDSIVTAKLKEANCRFGTIAVNTKIELSHRSFSESYSRPQISSTTLDVEEFQIAGEILLKELELFIEMDKELPLAVGCLIYGAGGTGKTSLVTNMLRQTGIYNKYVKFSDLTEPNLNQTMENFTLAFNHRGILIIDELEHLKSPLVQQQLLKLFQKSRSSSIFVVGITTDISALDQKLKSTDAFFTKIQIPLPKTDSRIKILRHYLSNACFSEEESRMEEFLASLSLQIQGYSPADIAGMVRQAILIHDTDTLTFEAIRNASKLTSPSNLSGLSTKVFRLISHIDSKSAI
jgi:ATPase family associated with various cellular activities (AAA)